jgi:hypothetical protein
MSIVWRRTIPLYLSFIVAIVIVGRSMTDIGLFKTWGGNFLTWSSLIRAITVGLGFISILLYHGPKVMSMTNEPIPGQWFYSLTAIVGMLLFAGLGVFLGVSSSQYQWLYAVFYRPVAGLSTAVSGFFALTAMYRAFRVRSLEAFFLIGPALLILLYDAPIGTIIPGLGPVANYIFVYIASAAFRGFIAAASLGTLITSIRTIIGRERGYLPEEA